MTRLKFALSALLLVLSATAFAEGYDEWNCRERDMLKGMGLQCVSCGVQQYYSDKGQTDVVPSEKWIALLAVGARQFRQLSNGRPAPRTGGYSDEETNNMKKVIISQIQAYGFCTKYISSDTLKITGGKDYRDLSGKDWDYVKSLIKADHEERDMNKAAKFFGFKDGFVSDLALPNMRSLMDDEHLRDFTVDSKRKDFKDKLRSALAPEYTVSGERSTAPQIIGAGDKDNGLRQCLEEVQQRLKAEPLQNSNVAFCSTMAKACQMNDEFCGGKPKVHYHPSGNKNLPSAPSKGSGSVQ